MARNNEAKPDLNKLKNTKQDLQDKKKEDYKNLKDAQKTNEEKKLEQDKKAMDEKIEKLQEKKRAWASPESVKDHEKQDQKIDYSERIRYEAHKAGITKKIEKIDHTIKQNEELLKKIDNQGKKETQNRKQQEQESEKDQTKTNVVAMSSEEMEKHHEIKMKMLKEKAEKENELLNKQKQQYRQSIDHNQLGNSFQTQQASYDEQIKGLREQKAKLGQKYNKNKTEMSGKFEEENKRVQDDIEKEKNNLKINDLGGKEPNAGLQNGKYDKNKGRDGI